jgi:branched-chain amino acid transport system permease protein
LTGIHVQGVALGSVTVTSVDIASVVVLWLLAIAVSLTLRYSRLGRVIKAVRVNPEMADIIGVNRKTVYILVFAIGSLLAGVVADFAALKGAAVPNMGFQPLLYAFVVAFIAGSNRTPFYTMAVGVLIGLVESLSGIWLSAQWATLVVYVILFIYLTSHSTDWRSLALRVGYRPALKREL